MTSCRFYTALLRSEYRFAFVAHKQNNAEPFIVYCFITEFFSAQCFSVPAHTFAVFSTANFT